MENENLICEGYSSAWYLWEHYPEIHDFLKPIVKANKCTKIYPCYLKYTDSYGNDYYYLRFMGKVKHQYTLLQIEINKCLSLLRQRDMYL